MSRRLLLVLVTLVALVGAGVGSYALLSDDSPRATRDIDLGRGLLSLPNEAKAWVDRQGGAADADLVGRRIASQPDAFWLVGSDGDYFLTEAVALAREQDRTVTLVLYNAPRRDDGLSGPQGAADLAAYQDWVDRVSAEIGDARAIVVVEPDALWFVDRQTPSGALRSERMDSLRYAVDTLSERNPRTRVYVEAGTSSGSVEPARMAELLAEVGVSSSVGFAVNVSSYAPDDAVNAYAGDIRDALRDDHGVKDPRYVVDTGRNGNPDWDFEWCNPDDRRLGHTPRVVGTDDGHDLDLWVKGPATSDGSCGVGVGSYGGQFLPDQAVAMSRH